MFAVMWTRAVFLYLSVIAVASETVIKKLCSDVNPSQCTVHSAAVDPCSKGVNFCSVKRNKPYTLTVDFTPQFSAQNLSLAMYGDDKNDGSFDKPVQSSIDACELLTCPVTSLMPRMFNMHFTLDKTLGAAKFPVKFKLWNSDDESQACCFTFNVKLK